VRQHVPPRADDWFVYGARGSGSSDNSDKCFALLACGTEQGDVLLQWHACQVLCHIANASPADYTQLAVKEGALVLVTGAMRGFPAHPQLQTAAIWFLDVCAALQPLHEMLMREHVISLCCAAIR